MATIAEEALTHIERGRGCPTEVGSYFVYYTRI